VTHKLFGLDEKINLAGRLTTIREQWQGGKARYFRTGQGASLEKGALRHWVTIEIDKDPFSSEEFDITEADYKTLGG
jgi:hypothetical protein